MSGTSAGVNASVNDSNTNSNSTTKTSGTSNTDFDTLLKELTNTTTQSTTALPQYAQAGEKSEFTGDLASAGMARDFLSSLLGNPYGSTGAGAPVGGGQFAPAINQMFASQLAKAKTGNASSAGEARQGFAQGDAIAQAQNDLLGLGTNAANSLLTNANPNSALSLIGAFAPKNAVTTQNKTSSNSGTSNTTTSGLSNTMANSNTNSWGVGGSLGCCFIFLEIYNGILPPHVRRCRDEFTTGPRRAGYKLLAMNLVPLMQRSKLWRRAVNWLMVKPLTQFGGWLYSEPGYRFGWLFAPFIVFWFNLFNLVGKSSKTT